MRFQTIVGPILQLTPAFADDYSFLTGNDNSCCPDDECYISNTNRLATKVTVSYGDVNVTSHIQLCGNTVPLEDLHPPIAAEGATKITLVYSNHFFELDGTVISNDDARVTAEKEYESKNEGALSDYIACIIEKDTDPENSVIGEYQYEF
ncbi:hypothetical protein HYALB_00013343 [Hymenoscyphus albidus]|uniref:Uncharacterized protein n=1 Tax=Hymenoscyphus albidus TaxID=595503 RepID=A0A9N9LUZ1_9HELO|nr:hypothetical protein HYALB_00013343 [Hymenoscyphus albidus]